MVVHDGCVLLLIPSCSSGRETRGHWGLQSLLALPSLCSLVSGLCLHLERCLHGLTHGSPPYQLGHLHLSLNGAVEGVSWLLREQSN